MCGIAGIVDINKKEIETETVIRMIGAIKHRGPDDDGIFIENGGKYEDRPENRNLTPDTYNIGLGHKRLSIIDLSKAGKQPMSNEDRAIWLVCNGEIYNYKELRKTLKEKGHRLMSETDSEVIIHSYEEYGDEFINYLQGMFAFGLWDSKKNRLIVARDRLGIKPLYYYFKNGKFLFASEIKSILTNRDVKKEIDFHALNLFLSFLYIPAPKTIFNDIYKVMPGHIVKLENGQISEKEFWNLNFTRDSEDINGFRSNKTSYNVSEDFYTDTIYKLLENSVKEQMMSDVPLGAFLSGGVDSSAIVGIMSKFSTIPVKTFSIGFGRDERFYDELKFARVVADKFHTDHREFVVKSDIVDLLPTVVNHFDEPFANPTAVLMYLLSEETKKHVSVALSGTGGDEAFSGYTRYAGMKISEYAKMVPFAFRKAIGALADKIPESSNGKHIGRRLRNFINGTLLSPEDRYISWVSVFQEELKNELFLNSCIADSGMNGNSSSRSYLYPYLTNPEISNIHDRVFYTDVKTYLSNNQLEYVDKMSMAHALEVRVPFCDHRLLEFSATIPYEMKIKGLNTKYLLKKAVSKVLPKEIINRKKIGFNAPLGIWFQGNLSNFIKDELSEKNLKKTGYFKPDTVKTMIDDHTSKRKDLSLHLWAILVFQVWYDNYFNDYSGV